METTALLVLVLGINLTLWTLVGGVRFVSERWTDRRGDAYAEALRPRRAPAEVGIVIPAHDEEPVIAATISSALGLVPAANVHVIADGCDDDTAEIARSTGVHVLELDPGRGKAGGIEAAIEHFDIVQRFVALLIVDADTELDEHYLARALPLLERPGIVAVAGYAKAGWRPDELSPVGRFLISYRARLYAIMQWLKYGQTWQWTNVTAIVPGFASMYRTSALDRMDLNPPGLIIEDFNMTFELHRRRLGKIAFQHDVFATTQDPDNFRDYRQQVFRWHLGFWQTLRRHGFWVSGFSAALALFILEILVASVGIVVLVGAVVLLTPILLVGYAAQASGWVAGLDALTEFYLPLAGALLILAGLDYLLTCVTALAFRRPVMLLHGLAFMALRFVDAVEILRSIPRAWSDRSDGRWTSPTRRPTARPPSPADRGQGA
ncbi:MAG TPA: glycosyltransferase family 2 protein [Nocardioidaceae bacterium]|nr:glycosyltransferase family 2 protein [Nocardioidaceae bacterium]